MLGYIISKNENIKVEEHEIKNFDILHKTDLNIFVVKNNKVLFKNNIVNNASNFGFVEVLEWFKNSGYEFKNDISESVMVQSVKYSIFYSIEWAINLASLNGHVKILEWFKQFGYKFKYTDYNYTISLASENGHVEVLEWFKNSGYKLFNTFLDLYWFITNNKNLKILKWLNNIFSKEVIKWSKSVNFIKKISYKTKNNYIKGYNKN